MSKVDQLIAEFAHNLRAAIAEEAAAAFAQIAAGDRMGNGIQLRAKPGPKPKALAAAPKAAKKAKWAKRTPEEIEGTKQALIKAVLKEPGLRSEQLAAALNTTTKDLALPLGSLVTSGTLKTKGQRRGTTYHPGRRG